MTSRTICATAREVQTSASYGSNGAVTSSRSSATASAEQSVCVTPDRAKACGPPCCRPRRGAGPAAGASGSRPPEASGRTSGGNAARSIDAQAFATRSGPRSGRARARPATRPTPGRAPGPPAPRTRRAAGRRPGTTGPRPDGPSGPARTARLDIGVVVVDQGNDRVHGHGASPSTRVHDEAWRSDVPASPVFLTAAGTGGNACSGRPARQPGRSLPISRRSGLPAARFRSRRNRPRASSPPTAASGRS